MSDTITLGEVTGLSDPKLRAAATHVLQSIITAAQRVTMNASAPNAFPLPSDANAVEHTLAARFRGLPAASRAGAVARMSAHLHETEATRAGVVGNYFSRFNFRSPASALDLSHANAAIPANLRMSAAELAAPRALHGPGGLVPMAGTDKVEFRVHEVRCVDETDPEWPGSDTIALGGAAINAKGETTKIAEHRFGDFDDGTTRSIVPPWQFATFNLNDGGNVWPKSYFASLVLVEKDNGGFPEFLNNLFEKAKKEILTIVGGAVGVVLPPVIAEKVGAALAWLLTKFWEWVKNWWNDDVFPPKTMALSVGSLTARFEGGATESNKFVVRSAAHGGTYDLTCTWRLYS